MSRWRISKGKAIDLHEWALEKNGVKKFLDPLPELPKKGEIKPGLYVSYEIDERELDGEIDWLDIGVAWVYAILPDGKREYLGEVRAYNWETVWLCTKEHDEIDNAEEWWMQIKESYEKLKKKRRKRFLKEDKMISSDCKKGCCD